MKSQYTENGKVYEKYIWKIENFSKLNSKCVSSDIFFLSGYAWRLCIFHEQKNNSLSIYLSVVIYGSPKEWCRHANFELVLANQVDASGSRTIVKKTRQTFNPSQPSCGFYNFISWDERCNSSKGFIVNDTCIVEVRMMSELPSVSKHLDNLLLKENSTTSVGDLVDFKGLGKIDKAFVPLLEEVCSLHPSLVDSQRKRKRTRMFTEWAFTALGRVLHFLKTKKVKDMNEDACNHLRILWEELETVGFYLAWLEPHFQSAVGMENYFERAANVKRLKENVDALEKDLIVALCNLAEAEKGFVERDLDAELGYGAP